MILSLVISCTVNFGGNSYYSFTVDPNTYSMLVQGHRQQYKTTASYYTDDNSVTRYFGHWGKSVLSLTEEANGLQTACVNENCGECW